MDNAILIVLWKLIFDHWRDGTVQAMASDDRAEIGEGWMRPALSQDQPIRMEWTRRSKLTADFVIWYLVLVIRRVGMRRVGIRRVGIGPLGIPRCLAYLNLFKRTSCQDLGWSTTLPQRLKIVF
jgi:hypothetical protein